MKKIFLLTSLAFSCCLICVAQQDEHIADSVVVVERSILTDSAIVTLKRSGLPAGGSPAGGSDSIFSEVSAVVKDPGKVSLQWKVSIGSEGDYFIVERSGDGSNYETIGALRREGNDDHFELVDSAPPNGIDIYRIRYRGQDGHLVYSKTMQVSLSGAVDFKFYPNPTDKLLIIRTAHLVDIQIVDATGVVRLVRHLPAGIQIINISSLEKGVYVLRVADKESNRVISNQLLKN